MWYPVKVLGRERERWLWSPRLRLPNTLPTSLDFSCFLLAVPLIPIGNNCTAQCVIGHFALLGFRKLPPKNVWRQTLFFLCVRQNQKCFLLVCVFCSFIWNKEKSLTFLRKVKSSFLAFSWFSMARTCVNTSPMTTTTTPKLTPQAGHSSVGVGRLVAFNLYPYRLHVPNLPDTYVILVCKATLLPHY